MVKNNNRIENNKTQCKRDASSTKTEWSLMANIMSRVPESQDVAAEISRSYHGLSTYIPGS